MSDHDHEEPQDDTLDTRARIEKSLEGILSREALDALLKDVLEIKKQARGWCGSCQKAVQVEIPDAKAVVGAMSDAEILLAAQAIASPAVDWHADGERMTEYIAEHGIDLKPVLATREPVEIARR